jgi:hypothetical protein
MQYLAKLATDGRSIANIASFVALMSGQRN